MSNHNQLNIVSPDSCEVVSIISVCYNEAPQKIRATLASILIQDYPSIELIIIDGGSRQEALDAFNDYKDRIKVLVSESDNGIFDAMNKGVARSSGEWIIFMNIGDRFYNSNSLSKLMSKTSSNHDIIYGNVVTGDTVSKMPKKISKYRIYRRCGVVCHQALIARRSLFSTIGYFDLNYKICGDPEWLIRAYKNGAVFNYVDEIVAFYEGNGFSSNYVRRQPYWEKLLLQHFSKAEIALYWVISILERAFQRIVTLNFSMPEGIQRAIERRKSRRQV